jgi:fermentation-respiration switch protein FrsA (DUF1100 family)
MRRWVKRTLWGVLALIVAAYLGVCVWLKVNETRLVFPRSMPYVPPSSSLALNPQRVEFGQIDGTKLYAWIISSLPADPPGNWLLLFHGSGGNVSLDANADDDFRTMGFSVMAPEYPGYLDSPGEPSDESIQREAEVAYDYLRTVKQVSPRKLVIFGGSLGGAFAIDLASRVEAGALVVHGGFTSILAMGRQRYPFLPLRLLVKNKMESDQKIGQVRMPVLLLHSTEDDVIPFSHAETLYALAHPPKRLVRLRGRHQGPGGTAFQNPGFLQEIAAFLRSEAGFQLRPPLPGIAPILAATLQSQGLEPALAQYRALKSETPPRYSFKESELSHLGYDLLRKERFGEAIAIFELNTKTFPQSWDAFDALGDAYAAAGKEGEALRSYRQSLSVLPDPANPSRQKIDQLSNKGAAR